MVQRKTGHDRSGQEHGKSLGPRPSRLLQPTTPEKQIVDKVTGGSPNYMKGTSSSEARRQSQCVQAGSDKRKQTGKKLDSCSGDKKQSSSSSSGGGLKKGLSFKRSCRIGRFRDVNAQRATCSSFLKDSKLPEYLMFTSPGVLKLCPYKYCSLNAHLHLQSPPLQSFISTRRRFLKSQISTKMNGDDCCVDIYVDEKQENGAPDQNIRMMIDNFAILEQSENASEDHESDEGSFLDYSVSFLLSEQWIIQDDITHCLLGNVPDEKLLTSKKAEDLEEAYGEKEIEKVDERIKLVSKTEETLLPSARKSCNREECTQDWKEFNPREPSYLPIIKEPSSEKVELKHQDMDKRRNAEEWMIDYALQHTVKRLALERKKKVALLVEAFETILVRETSPAFTYGRHLQACN